MHYLGIFVNRKFNDNVAVGGLTPHEHWQSLSTDLLAGNQGAALVRFLGEGVNP